jgi:hypothetical protein
VVGAVKVAEPVASSLVREPKIVKLGSLGVWFGSGGHVAAGVVVGVPEEDTVVEV